jgi:carbamoyltransferase
VVGYFDGRMEYGPRALGSRSILVNARNKSINSQLNKRLERTEFMPFAPVTPEYLAAESYINWKPDHISSYFMTRTYKCKPSFIKTHPAVIHIDGTARPQIIKKNHNPRYYEIIKNYCVRSKEKCLINTSFNAHEQPIISTPDLAIKSLLQNRIDILILSDYVVTKRI